MIVIAILGNGILYRGYFLLNQKLGSIQEKIEKQKTVIVNNNEIIKKIKSTKFSKNETKKFYYKNGVLKAEIPYENNVKHGFEVLYDAKGRIK